MLSPSPSPLQPTLLRLLCACCVLFPIAGCGHDDTHAHADDDDDEDDDDEDDDDDDHADHEEGDHTVPSEFEGEDNPYGPDDEAAVAAGKKLYLSECADCHGEEGEGDGPEAAEIKHDMPNLVNDEAAKWPDDFFLYRVAVGEEDHDMPAFEKDLGRKKIWQIISYLRTLQSGADE